MSRLDELIEELCPNGVEYKKLGNIATISRGGSFQKKDYTENGVPCIHYGQIYTYYNLFTASVISCISEETAKSKNLPNLATLLWQLRVKIWMMFVSVLPGLEIKRLPG